jgi:hypothetical protein
MSSGAAAARNAGFALISRINRWLVAAAVAVTGFVSLAAAQAFHGRTLHTSPAAAAADGQSPASSAAAQQSPGLSPAAVAPAPAPTSAPPSGVVSGGS